MYLNQLTAQLNLQNYTKSWNEATLYAEMFWRWMNYMVDEFTIHLDMIVDPKNTSEELEAKKAEAGIGLLASQAIYDGWSKVIYFCVFSAR